MAESKSILAALALHWLLRIISFPGLHNCASSLTPFADFIILLTVLLILAEIELVTEKYKTNGTPIATFAIETVASILIIEFAMTVIWARVELALYYVFKTMLPFGDDQNLTLATIAVSFIAGNALGYMMFCANGWDKIKCRAIYLMYYFQAFKIGTDNQQQYPRPPSTMQCQNRKPASQQQKCASQQPKPVCQPKPRECGDVID